MTGGLVQGDQAVGPVRKILIEGPSGHFSLTHDVSHRAGRVPLGGHASGHTFEQPLAVRMMFWWD
jgi:hypothetical protein